MSQIDNSTPSFSFFSTLPLSSFELERQAAIERNLFIQDCVRAAVDWLRMLVLRSARLARRVAAEQGRRNAIRQLERLDDRMLRDMGLHRGEIEFAVRNGLPARARGDGSQERRYSAPAPRQCAA
jgi:uncharacterized protein YjiS (DUF1127 family)